MRPEVNIGRSDVQNGNRSEARDSHRFIVIRGPEIGYHCHLLRARKEVDLGVMLTLEGDCVYAEPHRASNVKRISVCDLGERAKEEIGIRVWRELHNLPLEARRKHSQEAIRIFSYVPVTR